MRNFQFVGKWIRVDLSEPTDQAFHDKSCCNFGNAKAMQRKKGAPPQHPWKHVYDER